MLPLDRVRRIDCHVHYIPTGMPNPLPRPDIMRGLPLADLMESRPGRRDLRALTQVMDETGTDLGLIISTGTGPLRKLGPISEVTEAYNRSLSEDLQTAEGRFLATAVVDPMAGKDEIAQLERSLKLPNIAGIGLTTGQDGITLDDARYVPIFELARDYDVPITIHPGGAWPDWVEPMRLTESAFLLHGLGFLLADAMALFAMANAGVFERFPTVRFMFCQLAGVAPFCCGRSEFHNKQEQLRDNVLGGGIPDWATRDLSEILSHIWMDTHSQNRNAVRLVLDQAGDHTVVLGGDYPWTPPEFGMDYTMSELHALRLPPTTLRKIERDNALALIGHTE
ncbi:amidohydrolase [Nocardia sp. NEAU-G5]|uniref:Amidohydrolase n=1 Tax=Nocardia albiluteola TaxID=2842303 RepID=A0ABS6AU36_9NOCA|nr:amidohydrolase family protein [Nocardia albiluteola]MBU3061051.1 amidohydrolase [Nocardia albiluteola]